MPSRPDTRLITLCGSETRARVLGVLSNAFRPLTGYRVGVTAGVGLPKAYTELRRLKAAGVVRESSQGWSILDQDIAALFRKRYRLSWSTDWFRETTRRKNEDRAILERLSKLPTPKFPRRWKPRSPDLTTRDDSKDRLLRKLGLTTSLHGHT